MVNEFKLRMYFYKYFPDFREVDNDEILESLKIFEGDSLSVLLGEALEYFKADKIRSYAPRTNLGAFINMPSTLGSERFHLSSGGMDIAVGSFCTWFK